MVSFYSKRYIIFSKHKLLYISNSYEVIRLAMKTYQVIRQVVLHLLPLGLQTKYPHRIYVFQTCIHPLESRSDCDQRIL